MSSGCAELSCLPWLRRDRFEDAVAEGRTEEVVSMLQRNASLVLGPQSAKYRHSPWHVACHRGHLPVLQALVDAVLKGSQSSLLFTASLHRKLCAPEVHGHASPEQILNSCLMHGIRGGFAPLMLAARAGHKEVVAYLLTVGADIWQADNHGMTAIHHAARHNKFMVVQELLSFQAPPPTSLASRLVKPTTRLINCPDAAGWTALHYAVCAMHEETAATLLSCGTNIIARTLKQHATFSQFPAGATALHIAAAQGNLPMVILILRAHFEGLASLLPNQLETIERRRRQRAHPDPRLVISRTGQLPYHLARPLQRQDICEFLDPSIPLQFLLSATDEGTAGVGSVSDAAGAEARGAAVGRELAVVGVPRLSLLAAKALHQHLVNDLQVVEREQVARAAEKEARQAQERQARLQAAEAAAKQQGVWLVKRAARRSLLLLEQEEVRASGGGAAALRKTSRKPTVPNTPQRLLDAVRSGISIFTPQRTSASEAQGDLRTLTLELPNNPESNPVARVAPVRRTGSVGLSVMPLRYSVVEITTRPSEQPGQERSSLETGTPHLASTRRVLTVPVERPSPEALSSPFARQQEVLGAAAPHALLTAAHDDADHLVAHTSVVHDPSERSDPTQPTPSRWLSGTRQLSRPASAAPASRACQPNEDASQSEQSVVVAPLAAIRVVRVSVDQGDCTPGTATTVHMASPQHDVGPVTPLHTRTSPQRLSLPMLQDLPGGLSPVAAAQGLDQGLRQSLVADASPCRPLRPAPVGRHGAVRAISSRNRQRTGMTRLGGPHASVEAAVGASSSVAAAAGGAVPGPGLEAGDSSGAEDQPDTGPHLDPHEANGHSAARVLFQSLTRPFRRTSQVLPVMGMDGSYQPSAGLTNPRLSGSISRPLPPHASANPCDSMSSDVVDDSLKHVAEKGMDGPLEEPAGDEGHTQVDEEEDVCPVCLDDVPDVQLLTCKHALCLACAKDLAKRHCLTPALCPYCRGIISGFRLGPSKS